MSNNSATKKYHIVWSLFIFGGVFAAAGLLVFWFTTASPVLRYLETQSWLEVPANIRSISLESYVGDSTTWNISATYDYQINRSEERRVGKECRYPRAPDDHKERRIH